MPTDLNCSGVWNKADYCPKCQSRLFPYDRKFIDKQGVCSYCAEAPTTTVLKKKIESMHDSVEE